MGVISFMQRQRPGTDAADQQDEYNESANDRQSTDQRQGNQRADKSYDSDTGCEVAALAQITHATVTGGDANSSRIVGRGLGSNNGANEEQSGHQP